MWKTLDGIPLNEINYYKYPNLQDEAVFQKQIRDPQQNQGLKNCINDVNQETR